MNGVPRILRLVIVIAVFVCLGALGYRLSAQSRPTLSAAFARQLFATSAEAPFALRFFTTAVKTDSAGRITLAGM